MHRLLKQALTQAVLWQELGANPASLVKPPKIERKQMRVLDTDPTADLLETAREANAALHCDPDRCHHRHAAW